MEIRVILAVICVGIGCYFAGILTDAFLQADFIRQKDDTIRQLKKEKKEVEKALYHEPEVINHEAYKPQVEVIDLPQPDNTYFKPW